MDWLEVLLIVVTALLVLLALGMPVGLVLVLISSVAIILQLGLESGTGVISSEFLGFMSYTAAAIPLFILMGELLFVGGAARDTFDLASAWLRRLPGGLAVVAVGTSAIFGSISGSSLAATATVGSMTVPEMLRRGYHPRLATGAVAAAGGLAQLIPPSILLILYASIVEVPVGDVLMAALIPGLLLAVGFGMIAVIWGFLRPAHAPQEPPVPWAVRFRVLRKSIRPFIIIGAVTGTIFSGVATATEAAALGALAALVLAFMSREVSAAEIWNSVRRAGRTSAFILIIAMGGAQLSWVLSYNQVPANLLRIVGGVDLSPIMIMILIMVLYIVLDAVIDPTGVMVITLPIIAPLIVSLGFDPVWFGVLLMINLEMGLIIPPLGMGVFMVKGISPPNVTLGDVTIGGLIFLVADVILIAMLIWMPDIALWLPHQLAGG